MRPKLTIAIPTYNRAEKLIQCLQRVITYSQNKSIEIIISDNASSDNTQEYMKYVKMTYSNIKYFRNDKNLGFDGNFLNCFEKASGEYVWLLSDDDFILPNAIESILYILAKNPICIHLNSSTLKSTDPIRFGMSRFEEKGYLEYSDKNAFLKKIDIYCTFISSLIYKLDYVKSIESKKKYFNTNFLQSHILLEIMKYDGIYIVNTQNCIAARSNYTVEYDVLKTWIKNYSDLLLHTAPKCGFDPEIMSDILKKDLSASIYEFVLHYRRTCPSESSWDRDCIWIYINKYPSLIGKYRFAINCPICWLPILSLIYRIKKGINRTISKK
ncbi:MAG: glycosyltransferase family 2 protein [Lachnospiraceae bacterium]|nr:glycosyltransferase family 2 protein [Lachnospiraceae bacterium]